MGVDIYGKAPRSKAGSYFAANWGGWHELAETCWRVAPEICSQIDERDWHTNSERGLDDAGAIALADALERAIDSGALKHEDELSGHESVDDLRIRNHLLDDGRTLGEALQIPEGPWLINTLRNLIAFLRNSGGFKIW